MGQVHGLALYLMLHFRWNSWTLRVAIPTVIILIFCGKARADPEILAIGGTNHIAFEKAFMKLKSSRSVVRWGHESEVPPWDWPLIWS